MKKLVTYFLQGLLMVAPLALTIYLVFEIFDITDGLLRTYLDEWLGFRVPGLGIIIIFVLLVVLGFVGESIVATPFRKFFNRILSNTPFLNLIYSSLKDLFSAFVGKEKKFNSPVMVLMSEAEDIWKVGFITQESLEEIGLDGKVAVYFPLAYSFAGELFFVPVERVKHLEIPPAEAMKFIVSGGVTRIDSNAKNNHE